MMRRLLFVLCIVLGVSGCAFAQKGFFGAVTPVSTNPPGSPTNFSPTNQSSGVSTSGTISCASIGATGFTMIGPDTANPPTTPTTSLGSCSFPYSGLSTNTTYFVKMTATNSFGSSATITLIFTTVAGSAPGTPTSFSPTNGAAGVALAGTLTCSASNSPTSFTILGPSVTNPPTSPNTTPGTCSQAYSGLAFNTIYYVSYQAHNGSGDSSAVIVSFTTLPGSPPGTPTNFSPSNLSTSIALSGTLTCTSTSATSFTILGPDTSNPPTTSHTPSTCSQSYTGLANSTTYFVSWQAHNANGDSSAIITSFTTTAGGGGQGALLTQSDITCLGVFLTPFEGTGGYTTNYPITFHYVSGTPYYLQVTGDGFVVEFAEPALSPCSTALGSIHQATQDFQYGLITGLNSGNGQVPGAGYVLTTGVHWDETDGRFYLLWGNGYASPFFSNNIAAYTLNQGTQVKTLVGCWGLNGISNVSDASGAVNIPTWFTSTYLSAGTRLGFGSGGPTGTYVAGSSAGMVSYANSAPSPNSCASSTDYLFGPGTILVNHLSNGSGPNCAFPASIGCTPSNGPSSPYPQRLAYTAYSVSLYPEAWDPSGGFGYIGYGGSNFDWYKDANKEGLIAPYTFTSGWLNTTVAASPAPTFTYPNGTMTLTSIDTHDGGFPSVGESIWIETCVPGSTGCAGGNAPWMSCGQITSINTSTKAVAYKIGTPCNATDQGSGTHTPDVPGQVLLGCTYVQAVPGCSRITDRFQIYNPAKLGQIVSGANPDPSNLTYDSDFDLTQFMPQFISPNCSVCVSVFNSLGAPIADGDHYRFMIPVLGAGAEIGGTRQAVFVFGVAHP